MLIKLEDLLEDSMIIQNLKAEINKTNTFEGLQNFNELINNYLIRYKGKDANTKLKIFSKNNDIVLDDINNNNS